jgi:hypothetical protein
VPVTHNLVSDDLAIREDLSTAMLNAQAEVACPGFVASHTVLTPVVSEASPASNSFIQGSAAWCSSSE